MFDEKRALSPPRTRCCRASAALAPELDLSASLSSAQERSLSFHYLLCHQIQSQGMIQEHIVEFMIYIYILVHIAGEDGKKRINIFSSRWGWPSLTPTGTREIGNPSNKKSSAEWLKWVPHVLYSASWCCGEKPPPAPIYVLCLVQSLAHRLKPQKMRKIVWWIKKSTSTIKLFWHNFEMTDFECFTKFLPVIGFQSLC